MGAEAGRLAQRLRAALRLEEPLAVQELLHLGADPNLVLADGAAAVHLVAGARSPGALQCLQALLRQGADPNARSSEALTPLHVAAAWGCRQGLEILLTHGGDPTLQDQDGLQPLDWALQQGHQDCAQVLQELDTPILTPEESPEPTSPLPHSSILDRSLACNPLQEPQPGSAIIPSIPDDQTCWDSTVATLWLTEDEASILCDQYSDPSHLHQSVPTMSDLELLQALRALGHSPGPVTPFTRPHYLRWLQEAQAGPGPDFAGHSPELAEALRTGHIPDCQADEDVLAQEFEQPNPTKKWREGVVKSSFTYLLLDPRETQDLPARAFSLTFAECLQTFVRAVFYVGKGTRARPHSHLWEALSYHRHPGKQACPKVRQILDIWDNGNGVISLHCFQHVVAVEAYTREACLLDALGIQTLTNQKQGHYYGAVAGWPPSRRRCLGVHLLHRALLIFLAEGERELRPQDIQARS